MDKDVVAKDFLFATIKDAALYTFKNTKELPRISHCPPPDLNCHVAASDSQQ